MLQTIDNPKPSSKKAHLRPYRSPHLLVYGSLRELTTAGSGKSNEGAVKSTNKMANCIPPSLRCP